MSQGLGSGTATTIPWRSWVRTTWHPRRECLLRTRARELRLSTYSSSYERGGSFSSHSSAMLTSHSAEQASISSCRWEAGSISPQLVSAFRRVCPDRPSTGRLLPSGSIANRFTMRSDTFFELELEADTELAVAVVEERVIRDLELIRVESLWRLSLAVIAIAAVFGRNL